MPQKLRPSYKFNEEQLAQLKQIVPEAFKDGMLDFNSLYDALKDYEEEDSLEMDDNVYGLYWPGKRQAKRASSIPPRGTLVPVKGDSVDEENTKNIYIEGDNLEVLKLLQKSYAGKIKMIYIDPPYNTGNDFVYNDDFSESTEAFGKAVGQIDEEGVKQTTNSRTDGRFHSKWMSMMYPRLKLAHRLLTEDGVIFISIDDNEMAQLRKICDEIFGEENYIGQIVIKSNPRGSQSDSMLASLHEYVIVCAKNYNFCSIIGHNLSEEILSEYKYQDGTCKYRLLGLRQRGGFWRRSERPNLYFPIYVCPTNGTVSTDKSSEFYIEVLPVQPSTGEDGTWRWSKDKIASSNNELIAREINRDNEHTWDIFQKDFLDKGESERRTKAKSLWDEKEVNYQNGTTELKTLLGSSSFDYPKPIYLIKRAIEMLQLDNDPIILDFFSGSATTAHAVMQLNAEDNGKRQFIMVQWPEKCDEKTEAYKAGFKNICEIGKERIRRAGKKIKEEAGLNAANLDTGFKVYRLSSSNYKKWQNYTGTDIKEAEDLFAQYENPLVDNWKEENLLTEIMLAEGFPLDSTVAVISEFKKNKVTQISSDFCEHSLFVCLDKTINAETIKALA